MIKEVAPADIVTGVASVLVDDAVVVRGVICPDQAAAISALMPEAGKQRVYLSPRLIRHRALYVPSIAENRKDISRVVAGFLGQTATVLGLYVLRPDMLRNGQTKPHLDGRGAILSASLNLDLGRGDPTEFFAHRVGGVSLPYSRLEGLWEQSDTSIEDMAKVDLGVGDMIMVSRGVVHGSVAPEERRSITYRVRGLIAADLM